MDIKETTLNAGADLSGAAFSTDSGSVFVYCSDSSIRQVSVSSGAVNHKVGLSAQDKPSYGAFSPGGALIALRYPDRTARIFDAITGALKHKLPPHARRIGRTTFSWDGKLLATASWDHSIWVWDVTTGALRRRIQDGLGESMAIAFTPSGDRLLACNSDTDVRLFRTANGELERRWERFPVSMFQAAYARDGVIVAIGGADRTIYILDTNTGEVLRRLTGQPEMIGALTLSPDGKWLISSGVNELNSANAVEIRLWALATGETVWKTSFPRPTRWLEFSADSHRFGAGASGQIKVWSIT